MKKRLALAAALAFSIIPFASIEDAKAGHVREELEQALNRLKLSKSRGYNLEWPCWNKNNLGNDHPPTLKLKEKDGTFIVKYKKGKKFYTGPSRTFQGVKEAKEAFLNQWKKKCHKAH